MTAPSADVVGQDLPTDRAASAGPGGCATLAERLVALEAGIRQERHRQPAHVLLEIARLRETGATVEAIAAEVGVSAQVVRDRLRRAGAVGYPVRDQRRRVRKVLRRRGAELIAAYEDGASITRLAAEAGISQQTLRAFLVSRGIAIRRHSGFWIPADRRAELVAAYRAGETIAVLSGEAGACRRTLGNFLAARGVRLRHDRGWYRRKRRDGDDAGTRSSAPPGSPGGAEPPVGPGGR